MSGLHSCARAFRLQDDGLLYEQWWDYSSAKRWTSLEEAEGGNPTMANGRGGQGGAIEGDQWPISDPTGHGLLGDGSQTEMPSEQVEEAEEGDD